MSESIFIIGREPELSVAELEAIAPAWGATIVDVQPAGVLLEHQAPLPPQAIDRLGGSIKQVEVLECFDHSQSLEKILSEYCTASWLEKFFSGRIEFGISGYGLTARERATIEKHFLHIKKSVHAAGRAVRLVVSREPQLSAVSIQRNGLLKKGKEFVFFRTKNFLVLGQTTAVQDYRGYSLRDYGRPAANPKSGMLPPKLAQMMLNIARVTPNDILLDPFCGSGTVVQEAALLGVRRIHGSDSDPKSIKGAQENIRWLLKEFPDVRADIEITQTDARQSRVRVTVIVTEPYLGQPLRGHEPVSWLTKQKADLERLYLQVFQHWKTTLAPGARVVMVWPEFVAGEQHLNINLDQAVSGLGFVRQPLLSPKATEGLNVAETQVLSYGRDDARVRRQVRFWQLS